ncbi:tRNA (adenosine(37)-N6)-threonylcarbamoyltransferase complex dimerization subunit type 1 TsaB [Plantactinospora sp. GCM10030261]|uniref:tRNA (adenosine(37)-N6)-threonylcarbamoyltransferase complex dimerization subunit type 1 TsaB n=1 Tax=Plantactinospora sp. GCM10030261 TaxID=3273420 RepID=UPI003609CDC7
MLVLVLDSSTPAVTAALAEIGPDTVTVRAERQVVDARAHGELLAPQIQGALAEVGARPADLAAIVAGTGPGPFTGLRVGLVTAVSMGQALDLPTYGVCSLDAIGLVAAGGGGAGPHADGGGVGPHADGGGVGPHADGGPGPVLVASDARRREIYWGIYDGAGGRLFGPEVGSPAAAAARARDHGAVAAVGDGSVRYATQLDLPVRPEPRFPPAHSLARLAADRIRTRADSEPLTPLYLRRPDAVAATARKSVLPSQ